MSVKRYKRIVFLLRHANTGDLLINKVWQKPNPQKYNVPEELRISTAPSAVTRLPRPIEVGGLERVHFIETKLCGNGDGDGDGYNTP